MGEKRARTFTNFYRGTFDFKHMGVLESKMCTIFYGESVLKILASFDQPSVYLLFVVPERICVTKLVLFVQLE